MRQLFFVVLKVAISAALLYLALGGVNFGGIQARLGQINLWWAAAALTTTFLQVVVSALRWREIAITCGVHLPITASLRLNLIGWFFTQTLPSTVGGDGAKLLLLQRHGASWSAAAYSVLVDRAVGLLVLVMLVVGSLPWSLDQIGDERGRHALLALSLTAFAACVAFLVYGQISMRWIQGFWLARHLHGCARLTYQMLTNGRSGPLLFALSALNQLFSVMIAWFAALAIAAVVSFQQLLLFIPPIHLITTVPISIAGWGVREQATQAAFLYAGLSAADGVTISLLSGAAAFAVGVAGGCMWLLSSEKAAKDLPPTLASDTPPRV